MNSLLNKIAAQYLDKEEGESPSPQGRRIDPAYKYDVSKIEDLVKTQKYLLAALGHAMKAQQGFSIIPSSTISPDGLIGGMGYIMSVADFRKNLSNTIEVFSALTDTLEDEINAPHWDVGNIDNEELDEEGLDSNELNQEISDIHEMKQDPTGWVDENDNAGFFRPSVWSYDKVLNEKQ